MMHSKDAERILRIPAVHLAAFTARVHELAADPAMTFDRAVEILDAEMQAAGVTMLDFEMAQPGNAFSAPFSVSRTPTPESAFQASVTSHVHKIIGSLE